MAWPPTCSQRDPRSEPGMTGKFFDILERKDLRLSVLRNFVFSRSYENVRLIRIFARFTDGG